MASARKYIQDAPEQLVPAFRPLSKTSDSLFNYGEGAANSARDLIAGAGIAASAPPTPDWIDLDNIDGEDGPPKRKNGKFEFTKYFADPKKGYLKRAGAIGLSTDTLKEFFSEPGLVHRILVTTKLLIRLGYDHQNEIYKIYVKKENVNQKPSIIQVFLTEVDHFSDYVLQELLPFIDQGMASGDLAFRNPPGEGIPKPVVADFWEHDSVWMANSGRLRMRPIHKVGKCYQFYFNNPVFNSLYTGNFGPRIQLCRQELESLVKIFQLIKAECPPLDEM